MSGIAQTFRTMPGRMSEKQKLQNVFNRGYGRAVHMLSERYAAGAEISRVRNDWLTQVVGPTSLINSELKTLIARSQLAVRTTPYGKAARNVFLDYIIGTGLKPFPAVKDSSGVAIDAINNQLRADWQRFNDQGIRTGDMEMTVYEAQRLGLGAMIDTGTVLLNKVASKKGSWLPTAYQILNSTRLDNSLDRYSDVGTRADDIKTVHGINLNLYGEPVSFNVEGFDKAVSADQMKLIFVQQECEQYLGLPWFTPVLPFMYDLDELLKDRILASRLVAKIALWMKKSNKGDLSGAVDAEDGALPFEAMSILTSQDKPEVIQSEDRISETFSPLVRLYLHGIGAGLGYSYTLLTRDLSDTNFASTRFNKIADKAFFQIPKKFFANTFCRHMWREFVYQEFATGRVPGAAEYKADPWKFEQCYWLGDGEEWVDPLKDAKAQESRYRDIGSTTLQEICAAESKDWKAVVDQRTAEIEYVKSKGDDVFKIFYPETAKMEAQEKADEQAAKQANTALAEGDSDAAAE
jgi:lambda family phage portal protein